MSIITTPRLQRLWQDAQNYPEWAATRLWEYVFNHIVFNEDKWVVSSQQPPTHQAGDLRRVDLVVEKIDSDAATVATLLFHEVKRANASITDIEEVEYQAFTAACAHYVETGNQHIWAMTSVGSAARLWIFHAMSEYLIPFVPPGEGLAERSEYLELSTHGEVILDALSYVKRHIMPPRELLERHSTPRPTHTALPSHWHDHEVQQLDDWHHAQAEADTAGSMDVAEDSSYVAGAMPEAPTSFGPVYGTSAWAPGGDTDTTSQAEMTSGHVYGTSAWAPEAEAGGSSAEVNAGQYPSSSSAQERQGRKEVEVKVKVMSHTFNPTKKPEVEFERNGHSHVSNKEDWVQGTRKGRTVWVYHGKKTTYWTKKLG